VPSVVEIIHQSMMPICISKSWLWRISNSAKTGLVPANVSPRRRNGEDRHSTGQVLQLSL